MYLSRFLYNDSNPKYGLIDDTKVFILNSSFNIELDYIDYKDFITDEVNISDVQFLPPCEPSKIVGIALNYPGVAESKSDFEEPLVFIKGLNTLVLDWCIPRIFSEVEQFMAYRKNVSSLPNPIERSVNMSISGTKTLELKNFM